MSSSDHARRDFLRLALPATAGGWLLAQSRWASAARSAGPVVNTHQGRLQGVCTGGLVAFKGVRYGADTGGANRFLPPQPARSWSGIRLADKLGARAPQGGQDILYRTFPELERQEEEGEDCLFLNIWTNGVGSGKRPVMVWLHGGGYSTGSGGFIAYDGANLAHDEDVVVVTINHRLNVFGFLNAAAIGGEQYAHSVNLGMQDIVQALRWVHGNIAAFGGDPGCVTIFGQSGGGRKVSTLLGMPAAKGLFHRAIVQSGPALTQPPLAQGVELAQRFMARMGLKGIDELKAVPMAKLRALVQGPEARDYGLAQLSPIVDGKWIPAPMFEPGAPVVSADVPLMVGAMQTEETFFPGTQLDPITEGEMLAGVAKLLKADASGARAVAAAYREQHPAFTPLDVLQVLATDLDRRHGARIQADHKSALGKAAVYVYYFDWRSPVLGGRLKSYHTLDIPFVMRNTGPCEAMVGTGAEVPRLRDQVSGAWAAFARTGNPNHAGLPRWPAWTAADRPTMRFNGDSQVANDPNRAEREAIRKLGTLPADAA
jgi:para-nitrobenzyl esterase